MYVYLKAIKILRIICICMYMIRFSNPAFGMGSESDAAGGGKVA
jgi:hypothetical protein